MANTCAGAAADSHTRRRRRRWGQSPDSLPRKHCSSATIWNRLKLFICPLPRPCLLPLLAPVLSGVWPSLPATLQLCRLPPPTGPVSALPTRGLRASSRAPDRHGSSLPRSAAGQKATLVALFPLGWRHLIGHRSACWWITRKRELRELRERRGPRCGHSHHLIMIA